MSSSEEKVWLLHLQVLEKVAEVSFSMFKCQMWQANGYNRFLECFGLEGTLNITSSQPTLPWTETHLYLFTFQRLQKKTCNSPKTCISVKEWWVLCSSGDKVVMAELTSYNQAYHGLWIQIRSRQLGSQACIISSTGCRALGKVIEGGSSLCWNLVSTSYIFQNSSESPRTGGSSISLVLPVQGLWVSPLIST